MCSKFFYLEAKLDPMAYPKSNIKKKQGFLQNGSLFGVMGKKEKPRDFSLPKNGLTETWSVRADRLGQNTKFH